MRPLSKRDPLAHFFSWPRWIEDMDDFSTQKGLKIRETTKNIIAEAVVAGVPAKDIKVDIEDGILTIKAETKEEQKTKKEYRSSSYQYYYSTALSGGQWEKADAEIENGVVTVTIPKTESVRPKTISVREKKSE
jgi:HSP20 family protein